MDQKSPVEPGSGPVPTQVRGVTFHGLRVSPTVQGSLAVGEFEREIPFLPRRYFLVFGVPPDQTRGVHAHRNCHQFLIAVKGEVTAVVDDGRHREEFRLDRPHLGLYMPPMTWGAQYRYSPDAVLLVFASDYYDTADYIRDYSEFLRAVETLPPSV